jgi:hypothetical protein
MLRKIVKLHRSFVHKTHGNCGGNKNDEMAVIQGVMRRA